MTFNKIQKKIIKDIIEFKPKGTEILFKELFEVIIYKNFKEFGIIIKKDSVYIKSKKIIEDKSKVYELFFLIENLNKCNIFRFIKTEKNTQEYIKDYKYGIRDMEDVIKINLESSVIELVYDNLYSDYYTTSELHELVEMNFRTVEQKNLQYTLIALLVSIFLSFAGFGLNWYIATNVTKVEFNNPEQLKEILSTTIYLK